MVNVLVYFECEVPAKVMCTVWLLNRFSLDGSIPPTFTEEEDQKFARRLEEGYNLKIDARYNLWLETYYPHASENQDQVHGTVYVCDVPFYFMSI